MINNYANFNDSIKFTNNNNIINYYSIERIIIRYKERYINIFSYIIFVNTYS